MKPIKILASVIFLLLLGYLISCDITETNRKENLNIDGFSDCNDPPDRCLVPSYCDSGKGEHFCLYLFYGDTEEEFNYSNIEKVKVTHTGVDCNDNSYYCSYVTIGAGSQAMGCVLPWCNDYCSYTRSVCLETYDNKTYTGSRSFSYIDYEDCTVYVYQVEGLCDFGGIEE